MAEPADMPIRHALMFAVVGALSIAFANLSLLLNSVIGGAVLWTCCVVKQCLRCGAIVHRLRQPVAAAQLGKRRVRSSTPVVLRAERAVFAVIGALSLSCRQPIPNPYPPTPPRQVGFYQIAKLLMSPFVASVEMLWLKKRFPWPVLLCILLVLVGVAIVTVSDVTVQPAGVVVVGASNHAARHAFSSVIVRYDSCPHAELCTTLECGVRMGRWERVRVAWIGHGAGLQRERSPRRCSRSPCTRPV